MTIDNEAGRLLASAYRSIMEANRKHCENYTTLVLALLDAEVITTEDLTRVRNEAIHLVEQAMAEKRESRKNQ